MSAPAPRARGDASSWRARVLAALAFGLYLTWPVLSVILAIARAAVKRDWGGLYANHSIAKRIIELARDGARNPDVLCAQALSYFLR